ncbi:MAG: dephospho-CoA kinase [Planctomycetota bacterium]|jgi:dephospho-CoA kinase
MSRIVIGLVGGIASGKSTVAALFAEERPAANVDADAIARRVVGRPAVQKALVRRIPGIAGRDGKMDRTKLTHRVFSSARALAALEEVTHPLIRRAIVRAIARAPTPYVLVDAALLQETGADELCDAVVYVACPARTRRSRTRRSRGWTAAEHRAREARQWSCRRKRSRADFVVDNAGEAARARRVVRRILRRIERRG